MVGILPHDGPARRFVPGVEQPVPPSLRHPSAIRSPAMQLADLFAASLVGQAGDVAIEFDTVAGGADTLTFGDLHVRSNPLAHLLTARGLRRGDRVAVYPPTRNQFIDVLLACVKLGLVL